MTAAGRSRPGRSRAVRRVLPVVAACDVGGTFTDLVAQVGGKIWAAKVPTTPAALEEGLAAGLRGVMHQAGAAPRALAALVHGTTQATNALLQGRGGKTALLTNAGFEDAIEIGRQSRPMLYDLHCVKAGPLVPRGLRFGVACRLDKDGGELRALDEEGVLEAARRMEKAGVDACAVVFLHSYANPAHEARAADLLRKAGVERVTTSADVSPEFREAERLATTAANAFLLPVMERYLSSLGARVRTEGCHGALTIVTSTGGRIAASEAARLPVRTVLSGPAGGVAAACRLARAARQAALLSFDMGGTSTDICAIRGGRAAVRPSGIVAGLELRTPMLDVVTIGAGGGSVARRDPGGMMRVGPESAGAEPGPACYGSGGLMPTVTDADVVLGRIAPEHFLGGRMAIRRELADHAMRALGRELGGSVFDVAQAIIALADENMARGVRLATTERGLDPRTFVLCPFGGAGPLHAGSVARLLGMRRLLIPFAPAVFSAWGMLVADVRHEAAHSLLRTGPAIDPPEVLRGFDELANDLRARMAAGGHRGRAVHFERGLDLRYAGQSHELTVSLAGSVGGVSAAVRRFHAVHRASYGHAWPGREVQLVALRMVARARPPPVALPRLSAGGGAPPRHASLGERSVGLSAGRPRRLPVFARRELRSGNRIRGPAVVEGGDHTILLPADSRARVDPHGNLGVSL